MDSSGSQEGLARIMITVRKQGDRMSVDLSGSSPELPSGSNCNPHVVRAALAMALCMYVMPDLPVSSGVYEPIDFPDVPSGTCVSAGPEAGTSCGIRPAGIAAQGIHTCINRMMFGTELRERVALPFGTGGGCFVGGGPNQYGRAVAGIQCIGVMNGTGGGARPDADGVDSAGMFWAGSGDALDIEHAEMQLPNLYLFRRLAMDIAGPGRQRGGAPLSEAITVYDSPAFFMVPMVPSVRFPTSLGLFGGYASACSAVVTMHGTEWPRGASPGHFEAPSSVQDLYQRQPVAGDYALEGLVPGSMYLEGEGVAIAGEGGGGWGDALARDVQDVVDDLAQGIYSKETVRRLFCVVVDDDLKVDLDATAEARAAERRARLERGRPFAEFVESWSQQSPAPELLQFYGTWPEATPASAVPVLA
jgi:acetophenone carboxylase